MVDRIIRKKRWTLKRVFTIAGIASLVLLASASYYFTSGKLRLNVELDRITIATVTKGSFQETIPVNGTVLPVTSIYLDATEGGKVAVKYVEDGAVMKKGEPILKLSNTDIKLALVTQETNVYDLLTQMQISENNAQQNTVSKQQNAAITKSQYVEAERLYKLDKLLYEKKAIGSQEFKVAENNYNYLTEMQKLNQEILKRDSISTEKQSEQGKQSYEGSQNALKVMREKMGDLVVRAPIDGQLTSLDAEIGQNKNKGERLGQIDVVSGFKVRLTDVDEHYISRIFIGLTGTFAFADTSYKLKITKIYTQVVNGRFQVDMTFLGRVPKGIRRGQTLQILLALSDERQSILVPRGGFYQQTGGNWIFKVGDDGKMAYKVNIQLGNQNSDYYEVLDGLKPSDKVITSSYENYGSVQELVLKK
jgi:HlyD family secretion protein